MPITQQSNDSSKVRANTNDMSPTINPTKQVLESLSQALKAELTAQLQYLLHAKVCQKSGYQRLAEFNRKESAEELGHAEALVERILFLGGSPNMTDLSSVQDCEGVKEQLESDLALENDAIKRLNTAVKVAVEAGDNVSRQLFDKIVPDEDHRIYHREAKFHIINEIGLENYLARKIG
jgi:bacterioferritin